MKQKSEAHEALTLLFQWDGVPLAMICNNAKEMILVNLTENSRKLFTPWSNAPDREMKELMKGSGRKLIKFGTPPRLWDNCL